MDKLFHTFLRNDNFTIETKYIERKEHHNKEQKLLLKQVKVEQPKTYQYIFLFYGYFSGTRITVAQIAD